MFPGKCAKIPTFFSQNNSEIMKKSVEFSKEAITVIESGKKVVGQVYKDQATGKIVFEKFKQGHRQKDRTLMVHESGWLKESKTRIKFFSSVKKAAGAKCICRAMDRDLCISMDVIERELNQNC
jgi:hypothetical protein